MRVAENQRYRQVNAQVSQAKSNNANSLDDVSTQKSIRKISDNPIALTRAIRYRDQISNSEQNIKNMDMTKGYMDTSENALSSITDGLIRAKELSVAMANDTNNASTRMATSREIREIIDQVVMSANANYNGKYVFAGFRNQTPPVTEDGNYVGDDGKIFVEVSPGAFRPVNIPARNLFAPDDDDRAQGHFNMIHTLQNLYEGMMQNDKSEIQKDMSELEFHLEKVTSYQASVGGMWNAINNTQTQVSRVSEATKATLSEIEDADAFQVMSDFKKTEAILQSTLLASNKVLQPSLLNFLQ
jgi:flagellar hook-associated protein 3 FlgL